MIARQTVAVLQSLGAAPELTGRRAAKHRISVEHVALAVAGLASDYAKLITGETVYVDSGYHITG
jgi:enoyl-[acyl-carrier-protein] reductase (NADH)